MLDLPWNHLAMLGIGGGYTLVAFGLGYIVARLTVK